jgi:hypothetical protein
LGKEKKREKLFQWKWFEKKKEKKMEMEQYENESGQEKKSRKGKELFEKKKKENGAESSFRFLNSKKNVGSEEPLVVGLVG